MTLIDFIGFVIVMLAFLLLIIKQARDERKKRKLAEKKGAEIEDFAEEEEFFEPLEEAVKKEAASSPKKKRSYGKGFVDVYLPKKREAFAKTAPFKKKRQDVLKKALQNPKQIKNAVVLMELLGDAKWKRDTKF